MVEVEALKKHVLDWLSDGKEEAKTLIGLPWKQRWDQWHLILENEKIPFAFLIGFHEDALHITVRAGMETAVMENQKRLEIYRALLLLNQRIELAKFMLFGMNEEVIARVDLAAGQITKSELNLALNILLSSLYLMVQALHLEDQFNQQVTNRMLMMVEDLMSQGKNKSDILEFLTKNIGMNENDAKKVVDEVVPPKKEPAESMYG